MALSILALSGPLWVRGLRSESRAIAIMMAPASTASPASCPPISRGSSGTIAAAVATLDRCLCADGNVTPLPLPLLEPGLGEMVGNSPFAPPPAEPVPGGSVTGGKVTVVLGGVVPGSGDLLAQTTSIVPDAL